MVTKKRKSSGASILPNPTPKGQEKGTKKPVENAEVPFCIALPAPLPPSKKRKLGNASSPRVGKLHVSHFDPRLKLDYTVQRMKNADVKGEWDGEGMRIYNTFSRAEGPGKALLFHALDIVYVLAPGGTGSRSVDEHSYDYQDCYVAQVLECRALDGAHVYLRICWLYRPEDLPGGRQPYHGEGELIPSNDMQIINAETVHGKPADFEHLDETDFAAMSCGYTDLYWRQTYNQQTGEVSELRRICVCGKPANPDYGPLRCSEESCGQWMHHDCIERNVVERAYRKDMADKAKMSSSTKSSEVSSASVPSSAMSPKLKDKTWAESIAEFVGMSKDKSAPYDVPNPLTTPPNPKATADTGSKVSESCDDAEKTDATEQSTDPAEVAAKARECYSAHLWPSMRGADKDTVQKVKVQRLRKTGEPDSHREAVMKTARCLFCDAPLRRQPGHAKLEVQKPRKKADGESQGEPKE